MYNEIMQFLNLRKLKEDKFFRMNLIFFIGSLSISFLNYLYYPVLGRMLPIESFGEVQVIISIYTQITIFLSVLTLISVNIVVNDENNEQSEPIIAEFEKIAMYVSITLLILSIFLAPYLQSALKFQSGIPFVMLSLILMSSVPVAFKSAYLRGKTDFVGTSITGIISSTFKIITSVIFILFGFQTTGAIGGIIAAQIIALIYLQFRIRKHGFKKVKTLKRFPDFRLIKPQLPYAALVLVTSLLTTLQFSLDITLIKYLFSEEVAGGYAGISTIARIIIFVTGSFAIVILSSVKQNKPANLNLKILIKSFLITLFIGGSVTLIFAIFPTQSVHVLFGNRYDNFAFLLPPLSISMLLISLSTLLTNYHIALRYYSVAFFIFLGSAATAGLLLYKHESPLEVVQSLLIGSTIMFGLLFSWSMYKGLKTKTHGQKININHHADI
jgi:O-antigen/teichoic acid export membrane protein